MASYVFGIYDGGGCFWDLSEKGRVELYFVRPPVRPSWLKPGWMYRLKGVGTYKAQTYYVEEAIRDEYGHVVMPGVRGKEPQPQIVLCE